MVSHVLLDDVRDAAAIVCASNAFFWAEWRDREVRYSDWERPNIARLISLAAIKYVWCEVGHSITALAAEDMWLEAEALLRSGWNPEPNDLTKDAFATFATCPTCTSAMRNNPGHDTRRATCTNLDCDYCEAGWPHGSVQWAMSECKKNPSMVIYNHAHKTAELTETTMMSLDWAVVDQDWWRHDV